MRCRLCDGQEKETECYVIHKQGPKPYWQRRSNGRTILLPLTEVAFNIEEHTFPQARLATAERDRHHHSHMSYAKEHYAVLLWVIKQGSLQSIHRR